MTTDDILDAIGDIDSAYLEEAGKKPIILRKSFLAGALAACFVFLFVFPFGYYRHYLLRNDECNYVAEAYEEFFVYYVKDHSVEAEHVGVFGGDMEMFDVWKDKNHIGKNVSIQKISLLAVQALPDGVFGDASDEANHRYILRITVSASLAPYFEAADGALLMECLMKTIASYRNVTLDDIELIYS